MGKYYEYEKTILLELESGLITQKEAINKLGGFVMCMRAYGLSKEFDEVEIYEQSIEKISKFDSLE